MIAITALALPALIFTITIIVEFYKMVRQLVLTIDVLTAYQDDWKSLYPIDDLNIKEK